MYFKTLKCIVCINKHLFECFPPKDAEALYKHERIKSPSTLKILIYYLYLIFVAALVICVWAESSVVLNCLLGDVFPAQASGFPQPSV